MDKREVHRLPMDNMSESVQSEPEVPTEDIPVLDRQTSTNNISDVDDFDELLDLIKTDANLIDNLTEEQVSSLRKKLNPYGRTIQGQNKLTCLSITNLGEKYMTKFLTTALIGFLYRRCDEWLLSPDEPPLHLDNYEEYMAKWEEQKKSADESNTWLDEHGDEKAAQEKYKDDSEGYMGYMAQLRKHRDIVERAIGFRKRIIARQFLDDVMQYNPDKHVRSAYTSNPLDPERVKPAQIKSSDKTETKTDTKQKTKTKVIKGRNGKIMTIKVKSKVSEEESKKRENSNFVKHIPPADMFHRFQYYLDSNYEEVRKATQDLYCEKPDLEFAINPYDQLDNEEQAKAFVQKHKKEVITDILTLTNGKWNLLGSFKKNRERVNFYNENTEVISQIFDQINQDKKLGAELMRKRVKREKKKNEEKFGADEPEMFTRYKKDTVARLEGMGAENIGKDDNKLTTTEIHTQHEDCPYDAVQVDVFDMRRGGQEVKKSEFFTQAEAPKAIGPTPGQEQKSLK